MEEGTARAGEEILQSSLTEQMTIRLYKWTSGEYSPLRTNIRKSLTSHLQGRSHRNAEKLGYEGPPSATRVSRRGFGSVPRLFLVQRTRALSKKGCPAFIPHRIANRQNDVSFIILESPGTAIKMIAVRFTDVSNARYNMSILFHV